MITAAEFDRLADLPVDDPAGNMTPFLDLSNARRPGREVQRVNVDFPVDLLRAIDRDAHLDVGRDRRLPGHDGTERSTSSVASGRAPKRNGTNVVPSPGDTCMTPAGLR